MPSPIRWVSDRDFIIREVSVLNHEHPCIAKVSYKKWYLANGAHGVDPNCVTVDHYTRAGREKAHLLPLTFSGRFKERTTPVLYTSLVCANDRDRIDR